MKTLTSSQRMVQLNHVAIGFILLTAACTPVKSIDGLPSISSRAKPPSECQQRTQEAKAFLQPTEKLALVEQLHRIENKLFDRSVDDPTGCFDKVLREQIDRVANQLVYLTTTSTPTQKYQKAVIFDCSKLKQLTCQGPYADDTAHTLEFLDVVQVIPFKAADRLRVNINADYTTTQIDFHTGDHDAMHGSANPQKLKQQSDGTLEFRFVGSEKDQVLFAIVKGDGDRLYKKYVWVIRRSK
ncbi:MAG: hypothetical protein HC852_22780 [Acaryochloridaceae cyanobacterium RU_4_10]|nr:hypothetical protein [Acaryochloridaceae cyanobacterium RU_4_10]